MGQALLSMLHVSHISENTSASLSLTNGTVRGGCALRQGAPRTFASTTRSTTGRAAPASAQIPRLCCMRHSSATDERSSGSVRRASQADATTRGMRLAMQCNAMASFATPCLEQGPWRDMHVRSCIGRKHGPWRHVPDAARHRCANEQSMSQTPLGMTQLRNARKARKYGWGAPSRPIHGTWHTARRCERHRPLPSDHEHSLAANARCRYDAGDKTCPPCQGQDHRCRLG